MTTDRLNYLNVLLMVLSAILAYLFPFELFLFAYAVLGPLHYLTQISWLHDKGYYLRGKTDPWVLVGAAALITLLFLGVLPGASSGAAETLVGLAFWAALCFVLLKDHPSRWVLAAAGLAVVLALGFPVPLKILFGMFVPTLIHVFVFTGLFILMGALKGRSLSGLVSLAVFVGLALSFLFIHPAHAQYHAGDYVRGSYGFIKTDGTGSSPFVLINLYVAQHLHFTGFETGDFQRVNDYLYGKPLALSLMSFIAFAYTYHYLNWFSKTSLIGWHQIPRSRALFILVLWVVSLGLYAVDYSVGLKWLFFLSFTHVLLEFPLDQLTFLSIGRELWALRSPDKGPE